MLAKIYEQLGRSYMVLGDARFPAIKEYIESQLGLRDRQTQSSSMCAEPSEYLNLGDAVKSPQKREHIEAFFKSFDRRKYSSSMLGQCSMSSHDINVRGRGEYTLPPPARVLAHSLSSPHPVGYQSSLQRPHSLESRQMSLRAGAVAALERGGFFVSSKPLSRVAFAKKHVDFQGFDSYRR